MNENEKLLLSLVVNLEAKFVELKSKVDYLEERKNANRSLFNIKHSPPKKKK